MKRVSIICGMLFFCGLMTVMAQYRGMAPKVLAEMLAGEKKAGVVDDAPFVAYLDSLGFAAKGNGYQKECEDGQGKKVPVRVSLEKGKTKRSVKIDAADNGTIWWMVVQLKDLGLKENGHDGSAIFLKGKGLHVIALPDRLWLSYDIK